MLFDLSRLNRVSLAGLLLCGATSAAAATVAVTAKDAVSPVTRKDRQDSAEDLKRQLVKDGVRLADLAADADVILEIAERGTKPALVDGRRRDMPYVRATLRVGAYDRAIYAEYTQADVDALRFREWRTVAGKIAKQLEGWLDANNPRLADIRSGSFSPDREPDTDRPSTRRADRARSIDDGEDADELDKSGWRVLRGESDPLTDRRVVDLQLPALKPIGDDIGVIPLTGDGYIYGTTNVRCKNKLEVFIEFRMGGIDHRHIALKPELTLRLDKDPAAHYDANWSTNGQALFLNDEDSRSVLNAMLKHDSMLVQFIPIGQNPKLITFPIAGLADVVDSIREGGCSVQGTTKH